MPQDQLRRLLCLILPWVQILTAFLPMLGFGTSMAAVSAASRTPVVPAGYAFSIWSVIFALAAAYGIWQFLPANRDSALARRTGWPLAGSFAANTLWQVTSQLTGSVGFGLLLIILLSLACALSALFLARNTPEEGIGPRWIVTPLTGLLAGWLTAASFVNLSSAARQAGVLPSQGFTSTLAAVIILLAAGGAAAAITWLLRRDSGWFSAAILWAFAGVVAANLGINQVNIPAALAAGAMFALVFAVFWQRRRPDPLSA
ncbi:hypothetical protein J8J14_17025 [Roseomonas sp. SSH11]|uniref:Tryptophan-rich sensory protein n=1 Tax=Pararoseomonas baculiformis TaxID=2820812 RepID=A0ABS4AHK6_9PROT|nr:hypothetical protein [Pararoseomonas baculiformis]MBP0446480.1 hypothetical protein [Pararoseomonas baculiformis]